MTKLTRRELLIRLASGAGALTLQQFLTSCTPQSTPQPTQTPSVSSPTQPSKATETSQPTKPHSTSAPTSGAVSSPTNTAAPKVTPTPGTYDLVVARNGEPDALVRKAIAAFGGMEKFIKPGQDVIVKPNICVAYHTYEYAATTNPWVVGAIVKLALEAGARRVRVMDAPFGGTAEEGYVKSGIREQVEAAGGQMEFMPGFKYV